MNISQMFGALGESNLRDHKLEPTLNLGISQSVASKNTMTFRNVKKGRHHRDARFMADRVHAVTGPQPLPNA